MAELSQHKYVIRLKRNQTPEEIKFFRFLQKVINTHFPELQHCISKQVPIRHKYGFYILDFYIGCLQIAFEIDGGYHWTSKQLTKDLIRDKILIKYRHIRVIHIPNVDIADKSNHELLERKIFATIEFRKKAMQRLKVRRMARLHGWRSSRYLICTGSTKT